MSFIHDIIKIKYIREGYLSNIPYHLVSDEEMFYAFRGIEYEEDVISGTIDSPALNTTFIGYFWDNYYNPDESNLELSNAHAKLVLAIQYHIDQYLSSVKTDTQDIYTIPDWVYSYMLGAVVGPESSKLDIHDVIKPLGVDNVDDEFTAECAIACLSESKSWIRRKIYDTIVIIDEDTGATLDTRPPTIFGEPHVIKSIRLNRAAPELR
jgi:hypothetical protein